MLDKSWSTVYDARSRSVQHWVIFVIEDAHSPIIDVMTPWGFPRETIPVMCIMLPFIVYIRINSLTGSVQHRAIPWHLVDTVLV